MWDFGVSIAHINGSIFELAALLLSSSFGFSRDYGMRIEGEWLVLSLLLHVRLACVSGEGDKCVRRLTNV